MKKWLSESLSSCLALFLFSCLAAGVVVLGILLTPVLFVVLLARAIVEMIRWKTKTRRSKQEPVSTGHPHPITVVRALSSYERAA